MSSFLDGPRAHDRGAHSYKQIKRLEIDAPRVDSRKLMSATKSGSYRSSYTSYFAIRLSVYSSRQPISVS